MAFLSNFSINWTLADWRDGLQLAHVTMTAVLVVWVIRKDQRPVPRGACDSTGWLEEPKVMHDGPECRFYSSKTGRTKQRSPAE